MNKQPYYHRIDGLLFTATKDINREQFIRTIKKPLEKIGVLINSIDIEEMDAEPGDPSDLC